MRALLPALAVGVLACHRGNVAPVNPQAETALTVDNQNYLDMNVYLVRSSQRIRLGTVPGLTSRVIMLRPEYVGYGADLQFEVHPIGGQGNPITETVSVHPGDVIRLTIPPN